VLTQEVAHAAQQQARIRIVLDGGQFTFAPTFKDAASEGLNDFYLSMNVESALLLCKEFL
jgi:hypothetical protein